MAKKSAKKASAKKSAATTETKDSGATPSSEAVKMTLAGYVVLVKGKPLALSMGDDKPKNGVLERNERATLFTRATGAQGAINRTVKFTEGKKGALNPDNCAIVRVDRLAS